MPEPVDRPEMLLIRGGDLYAPEPREAGDVLIAGGAIFQVGEIDVAQLRALGIPFKEIDASGCIVVPGFIDPHQHVLGAGMEEGFGSRMPEVTLRQVVCAGITTIVGCLGTDTTTRSPTALLGKVRELRAEGISGYMYTGGFPVPPPTITGSLTDDVVIIPEVIGVGQVAISDTRSSEPTTQELARIISQVYVGGLLSGKVGVTHIHVGSSPRGLEPVRRVLDEHDVPPDRIMITHVNRNEDLMDDAIELAHRGVLVNIDSTDCRLGYWLRYYREHGGPLENVTVSSDAHTEPGSAAKTFDSFRAAVLEEDLPLEEVLPPLTRSVASALHLPQKGRIEPGCDADLLVLGRDLHIEHVIARGRYLVERGELRVQSSYDRVQR